NNVDFLKRCARWIPVINFADHDTGEVYARLDHGKWAWRDRQRFEKVLEDPDARAGLLAVAPNVYAAAAHPEPKRLDVTTEKAHTLGGWRQLAIDPVFN